MTIDQLSSVHLPLGKKTPYVSQYDPSLLFPIARRFNREKIGLSAALPFMGCDSWNHYEVSWLNEKGKPVVGIANITIPCESENLIESKSMKLYFNSFNNTKIKNVSELTTIIKKDIEANVRTSIDISIFPGNEMKDEKILAHFEGTLLDTLDITCTVYEHSPQFLKTKGADIITETVCSDLLKSNCLVTQQPDWGSLQITYTGKKINHAGLLQYIVSFRNTQEFAETAAERIFLDIQQHCTPTELTVYASFTRRGGVDINALRTTEQSFKAPKKIRLYRQ